MPNILNAKLNTEWNWCIQWISQFCAPLTLQFMTSHEVHGHLTYHVDKQKFIGHRGFLLFNCCGCACTCIFNNYRKVNMCYFTFTYMYTRLQCVALPITYFLIVKLVCIQGTMLLECARKWPSMATLCTTIIVNFRIIFEVSKEIRYLKIIHNLCML